MLGGYSCGQSVPNGENPGSFPDVGGVFECNGDVSPAIDRHVDTVRLLLVVLIRVVIKAEPQCEVRPGEIAGERRERS